MAGLPEVSGKLFCFFASLAFLGLAGTSSRTNLIYFFGSSWNVDSAIHRLRPIGGVSQAAEEAQRLRVVGLEFENLAKVARRLGAAALAVADQG